MKKKSFELQIFGKLLYLCKVFIPLLIALLARRNRLLVYEERFLIVVFLHGKLRIFHPF